MPNPQSGETHLPANCFIVFDHFMGLAPKGLRFHLKISFPERISKPCQKSLMKLLCEN